MAIRRKSVNTWVKNLKKSDNYYLFELGPKPEQASKIIQRFVKKLLFKFKIRRILRVYNILRAEKVEEMNNRIRRSLRVLWSNNIIADIKFELYKRNRLHQIRQKISIISVRTYWRKSKFTFKIIMQKIKKFKRMMMNKQRIQQSSNSNLNASRKKEGTVKADFLAVENLNQASSRSSFNDDSNGGSGDEEGKEKVEDAGSLTSELNKKIEQERQEKLENLRLAYSLPRAKEPANVLPYLYQKDILEGISPPSHYISTTRATVFRMNNSDPKRQSPSRVLQTSEIPKRSSLVSKPFTSPASRRPQPDGNPAYMKPTTASKMCRWDAEAPNEEIEEMKKNIKPREDSKVLYDTFAYSQKKKRAYLAKEKGNRPIWRPSTQYQEVNLPSVDLKNKAQTPRAEIRPSTMSFSPRTRHGNRNMSVIEPIPENKFEVNSLSFEAALPGLASMLSSYNKGFTVNVRPGLDKVRGFK